MDFYQIRTRETKEKTTELYPDFIVGRSKDLMVQGKTFYAIWDEAAQLWSRDEYDVQRLVDEELDAEAKRMADKGFPYPHVKRMRDFSSGSWSQFRKFLQNVSDSSHPLDSKLIWANTEVKKSDYASKKLPYAIGPGDHSAWDELLATLYSPAEREKIEWAIGSIVSGDSKKIQKFLVFYGPPGTGKSTVLNIIQDLFHGYTAAIDAKALGNSNSAFATEVFKSNPLVAIQHDGDLSRLDDNARLNSVISHEEMTMNEKYKPSYSSSVNAMLFIGSNQPVKISDAKSGILRRLIDVHPTGAKVSPKHYQALMSSISLQLGAVADHCHQVYLSLGKNHYGAYRPTEMMLQTDVFFNFIEAYFDVFSEQDGTYLKQAYKLYKEFCEESGVPYPLPQYKMREELRNYFEHFHDRGEFQGEKVRSVYLGFTADKFKQPVKDTKSFSLVIEDDKSLLDEDLAWQKAQLANEDGNPTLKWINVKTNLSDIDTSKLHWVKVPKNHIVIDFDLKDENGDKSLELNLEAASQWPATYAEISKSGAGVHLHYTYSGDVGELAPEYASGIEVKVYRGDSALRRSLSKCNSVPVASISSGLPLKEKKAKVPIREKTITSERGLRDLIQRNLRKEIHPGTKSSIDFIAHILEDQYNSDMQYDVSDLKPRIIAFASRSTNQAPAALKVVTTMKFQSKDAIEDAKEVKFADERVAFYDVEVYSNLFVVCWKFEDADEVVRMINPSAAEIENLFKLKLVGFYNRKYDNHILYAASMGSSVEQLYKLSQKIIENDRNATFAAAYSVSYADIYDFASKKMSLKKWEIELGVHHLEMDIPWDKPVEDQDIDRVVEYCVNDVKATEAVWKDRAADFTARQILAELSGLTVNDTTQRHTAKILFGDNKKPQDKFVYTDLSEEFPGYEFRGGKSEYKGEDPGEGGYVYAEPGMYENVALLDVASMHPRSLVQLNAFGPYTKRFEDLMDARLAIKAGKYDEAGEMLDGRLKPYLGDESQAKDLSYALKIVINIVYGLTSAKFENPFKDFRNIDNIVAKRGALFMIDLKHFLQAKGYQVAHIKTDSVKIPLKGTDDESIVQEVMDFGAKYGYTFEWEATYDKFCLVNDAVYVAHDAEGWHATGAQFQHPVVFNTLFGDNAMEFDDFCEAKSVSKGAMYLAPFLEDNEEDIPVEDMHHQGKTGRFIPVKDGGKRLLRIHEGKQYAVAGTKGFLWLDAEVAKDIPDLEIDYSYSEKLVNEAVKTIEQFGRFDNFVLDGEKA